MVGLEGAENLVPTGIRSRNVQPVHFPGPLKQDTIISFRSSPAQYTITKPVDGYNLPICVDFVHAQHSQLNKRLLNMRKDSALTDWLSRSEHVKELSVVLRHARSLAKSYQVHVVLLTGNSVVLPYMGKLQSCPIRP